MVFLLFIVINPLLLNINPLNFNNNSNSNNNNNKKKTIKRRKRREKRRINRV